MNSVWQVMLTLPSLSILVDVIGLQEPRHQHQRSGQRQSQAAMMPSLTAMSMEAVCAQTPCTRPGFLTTARSIAVSVVSISVFVSHYFLKYFIIALFEVFGEIPHCKNLLSFLNCHNVIRFLVETAEFSVSPLLLLLLIISEVFILHRELSSRTVPSTHHHRYSHGYIPTVHNYGPDLNRLLTGDSFLL